MEWRIWTSLDLENLLEAEPAALRAAVAAGRVYPNRAAQLLWQQVRARRERETTLTDSAVGRALRLGCALAECGATPGAYFKDLLAALPAALLDAAAWACDFKWAELGLDAVAAAAAAGVETLALVVERTHNGQLPPDLLVVLAQDVRPTGEVAAWLADRARQTPLDMVARVSIIVALLGAEQYEAAGKWWPENNAQPVAAAQLPEAQQAGPVAAAQLPEWAVVRLLRGASRTSKAAYEWVLARAGPAAQHIRDEPAHVRRCLRTAAARGDLCLAQALDPGKQYTDVHLFWDACHSGRIDFVNWAGSVEWFAGGVSRAAQGRHYGLARHLLRAAEAAQQDTARGRLDAAEEAFLNGDLAEVEYFVEPVRHLLWSRNGESAGARRYAAQEIFNWLEAAERGHFECAKWSCEQFGVKQFSRADRSSAVRELATRGDCLELAWVAARTSLAFLHHQTWPLVCAMRSGAPETFFWLVGQLADSAQLSRYDVWNIWTEAILYKNLRAAEWVEEHWAVHGVVGNYRWASLALAAKNSTEVLEWYLRRHAPPAEAVLNELERKKNSASGADGDVCLVLRDYAALRALRA